MNIAMKKRLLTLVLLLSACSLCPTLQAKGDYPYRNAKLPTTERVADLLNRMTLEEKIGQLRCLLAWDYYTLQQNKVYPSDTFKKDIAEGNIGMLWATFRADPWTKKSLSNGLTPYLAAQAANTLQKYAIEHTRLGLLPHGIQTLPKRQGNV